MLGRRLAARLPWLDAVGDRLQPPLRDALQACLPLRDALDGVWLGAPLHPPLTDVPIGAATTAALLDVAGASAAADRALAAGVLATLPAAVTGTSDWRDLRGDERRLASLHAVVNVAALVLNVRSLALRARGRRAAAVRSSLLGLGLMSFAAHLGGELTFGRGVRVNRTAWEPAGDEFQPVFVSPDELHADDLRGVEVDGEQVLLTRTSGGDVCTISAICSHLGGPLAEGTRDGDHVVCPWHGSTFDLCTGAVVHGPAVFPQPRYEVRERDGAFDVRRVQP